MTMTRKVVFAIDNIAAYTTKTFITILEYNASPPQQNKINKARLLSLS